MSPTYMNPPFILHTNTCLCRRVYVFLTNMYMYNAQPSHSKPKKLATHVNARTLYKTRHYHAVFEANNT